MSGAFADGGTERTAAGGLSACAGGGGDETDAGEAENVGTEGTIGLDAEGSLNVKFSTAACNSNNTIQHLHLYETVYYAEQGSSKH